MKRTLYVLALGIFGITTTEFGVIGILPQIANTYHVTIDKAGWLLSIFALIIAISAPFITLAFSNANRKKTLLLVVAVFFDFQYTFSCYAFIFIFTFCPCTTCYFTSGFLVHRPGRCCRICSFRTVT